MPSNSSRKAVKRWFSSMATTLWAEHTQRWNSDTETVIIRGKISIITLRSAHHLAKAKRQRHLCFGDSEEGLEK
ncbi:hypothetical protein E2C01_018510 [Portunus trituberculatus]|uniref:Uncharacterized protein n=1 Tax=Portunus trituberculatus TaxID=210409 RepID=A0A5B7DWD2_PORTR|nr:hypothetical protein [Portunus trituberculatus]